MESILSATSNRSQFSAFSQFARSYENLTKTERLARFERAARLPVSLNHLNIGGMFGLEQAEGRHFLLPELVEGQTLLPEQEFRGRNQ